VTTQLSSPNDRKPSLDFVAFEWTSDFGHTTVGVRRAVVGADSLTVAAWAWFRDNSLAYHGRFLSIWSVVACSMLV